MRTVRNNIWVLFIFFAFVSCKKDISTDETHLHKKTTEKCTVIKLQNPYTKKEGTFLMSQKVFAIDSCFGVNDALNFRKAADYLESKHYANNPYIKYLIKKIEKQDTITIWQVREDYYDDILLNLSFSKPLTQKFNRDSDYIKITRKDSVNNTEYALIFELQYNNKLLLNAKEKQLINNNKRQYCFDTINKELTYQYDEAKPSKNEINFTQACVYAQDLRWICK